MPNKKKSSCFSVKIDLSLAPKIEKDLINQGFSITKPPYTIFCAIKKGISVSLYQSGSLTVQGKEKDDFIEFYLEPEILKTFVYTHQEVHLDLTPRIGVDEAGKGDFFGPLCTCALYADKQDIKKLLEMGVKDSKRLTDKKALKLGQEIVDHFPCSIIKLFPMKYNELYGKFRNLNFLLAWTHATAIKEIVEKTSCEKIIVDQFAGEHVMEEMLQRKNMSLKIEQKTKAEEDIVVAAASIVARMSFLQGLKKLEEDFSYPLPKGASSYVVETGEKIAQEKGVEFLDKVSKRHFKTRDQILHNIQDALPKNNP